MTDISNRRILWKLTEEKNAKILRVFADSPNITIPSRIAGYQVTELGDHCFAPVCHLPADGYQSDDFIQNPDAQNRYLMTELSGNYVQEIVLPDTLYKIGDFAFYNCRNLTSIDFGNKLAIIGSDAFMNCNKLGNLYIRCGPFQPSGLRQILAQIPWDVEVAFYKGPSNEYDGFYNTGHTQIQTAIFYPEYYETYDEIAPAHVFGRSITGEGFRARHSFKDGIIDYARYDTIFQKACAEESEHTICRLVLCRLRYPTGLSKEKKEKYESYLKNHGKILCKWLVHQKQLDALFFLFHQKLLSHKDAQYAIMLAAETEWTEGSANMIRWQRFTKESIHHKYAFDEF